MHRHISFPRPRSSAFLVGLVVHEASLAELAVGSCKTTTPRAAVRELLLLKDPERLLAESGYSP